MRDYAVYCDTDRSPSMRREWIEICWQAFKADSKPSLPPCGGSGLKCAGFGVNGIDPLVSLHAEGVD